MNSVNLQGVVTAGSAYIHLRPRSQFGHRVTVTFSVWSQVTQLGFSVRVTGHNSPVARPHPQKGCGMDACVRVPTLSIARQPACAHAHDIIAQLYHAHAQCGLARETSPRLGTRCARSYDLLTHSVCIKAKCQFMCLLRT